MGGTYTVENHTSRIGQRWRIRKGKRIVADVIGDEEEARAMCNALNQRTFANAFMSAFGWTKEGRR